MIFKAKIIVLMGAYVGLFYIFIVTGNLPTRGYPLVFLVLLTIIFMIDRVLYTKQNKTIENET